MSKNKGWIKLHRDILENPVVMKDSVHLALWVYLLLKATHVAQEKMFAGKKIILKPGQLITGRAKIANDLGEQQTKVYRALKDLKNEHQIEQQTSNQGSLITVVNWEKYQNIAQQNKQQMNNERTTSEQQTNTNKNIKNNKNVKNVKKTAPAADPYGWED